jgi:hypothetical protein
MPARLHTVVVATLGSLSNIGTSIHIARRWAVGQGTLPPWLFYDNEVIDLLP